MPEEMIFCPSCNRKVRIPTELLGTAVKCPLCGVVFTAPMPPPVDSPGPPPVSAQQYGSAPGPPPEYGQTWAYGEAVAAHARSALAGPAVGLIAVGVLAILIGLVRFAIALLMPDWMAQVFAANPLANMGPRPTPEGIIILTVAGGVFALVAGSLTILAGVQMLRLRMWGLAMAGSVIAMINCVEFCCVLGLPFAIWAVVVLVRPEVKAAFR